MFGGCSSEDNRSSFACYCGNTPLDLPAAFFWTPGECCEYFQEETIPYPIGPGEEAVNAGSKHLAA
jgi:hypothetical protein